MLTAPDDIRDIILALDPSSRINPDEMSIE